jgi:hypothetical protein
MVNAQLATNPAQIHPIHIQLHCLFTKFSIITMWLLLRRIFTTTQVTPIALAPGWILANFVLLFFTSTFWTFHLPILPTLSPLPSFYGLCPQAEDRLHWVPEPHALPGPERYFDRHVLQREPPGALALLDCLVEFGLMAWIMCGGVKNYLSAPACEDCGSPLGTEKHLGGTAPAKEPLLLHLLRRHDMSGLGALLVKDAGLLRVELDMHKREKCGQSTSVITARHTLLGAKDLMLVDISKATLLAQEGARFLQPFSFEEE